MLASSPIAPDPDDQLPAWFVAPGAELVDGHLAIERLATGHRCETWLTWSTTSWCPAVVKIVRPHQVSHPRARAALGREVDSLGGLFHPGLPALWTDGRTAAVPYLVFEFVDGGSLDDALTDGPVSGVEAALLGAQLLSALALVHDRGLVHVDVKPENVLLSNGKPVLLDFGSARRIGAEQPSGLLIGTAGYAAPELEAGAPIAVGMDLFGIGVTLFEALGGEPAFDPELAAVDRPRPSALPSTVPPDLAEVVLALLEPDPVDRPTAVDLQQAFACGVGDPDVRPWPKWADEHLARRFSTV